MRKKRKQSSYGAPKRFAADRDLQKCRPPRVRQRASMRATPGRFKFNRMLLRQKRNRQSLRYLQRSYQQFCENNWSWFWAIASSMPGLTFYLLDLYQKCSSCCVQSTRANAPAVSQEVCSVDIKAILISCSAATRHSSSLSQKNVYSVYRCASLQKYFSSFNWLLSTSTAGTRPPGTRVAQGTCFSNNVTKARHSQTGVDRT